jgi:protein TonB
MQLDMRVASVSPSRMMLAVSLAVLLEAGAIYLVGSGLGARIIKALPGPIIVSVVEPSSKPAQLPPPSPARFAKPSIPMVSRPNFDVQTPQPPNSAVGNPLHGAVGTQGPASVPVQPATRSLPVPTPPVGIAATHTQPRYPMLARRLGEQGAVLLTITIGADGSVENAAVAKSSGKADLDEAAVIWVTDHWKYRPASRNGQPVAAQIEAQVVFDLNQAR